jgi:UDP-N-acetylglucosamine 4,6-dehydratase
MENIFKDKNILVTGGAGSIGSEIVRQVLKYKPNSVRSFDNNETGQFDLEQEHLSDSTLRLFIGDIRDKDRLNRAMNGVDIVFHAAALKHVPLCEYNPFEAIKTNVMGTQNLVECAIDNVVEKFITISTDKATNPINTMGATKLLAERLTIDANNYKREKKTALSCVRFGNVLNSRGSVTELFRKQISSGGPLTVTDPEMTRFVMSIEQAVGLILKAVKKAQGGEIFILKMPVLKLKDLQDMMLEELAPKYGYKPSDIKINRIGIRAGEKFYEELMTEEEAARAYESDEMFTVLPQIKAGSYDLEGMKRTTLRKYTSHEAEAIKNQEIRNLIFGKK